jgi:iron-sulfur cluster assembly accessory protein
MDVIFTPAAEKFIRRMLRFSTAPTGGFRLMVKPGGCSGLAAEFNVEETMPAGDAELMVNGLRVFLPAESRILLTGVTVDFADTMMESGFVFRDPKNTGGSCGSSDHHHHAPVQLVQLGTPR